MSGRFITFEGGEGAGKSTQVERLCRRLEAKGLPVVRTREPGGSPRAEAIRASILGGEAKAYGPFAEALMFSSARLDHLEHTIRPALARGAFVICDRFADSTRAYQGALGHVEPETIAALERIVVGDTRPDLTFVLDVPEKLGLARARERRGGGIADRFEQEGSGFHKRLRQAFLDIAAQAPERCVVVDASEQPDAVERVIWREVERRLLAEAEEPPSRPADAPEEQVASELVRAS